MFKELLPQLIEKGEPGRVLVHEVAGDARRGQGSLGEDHGLREVV